MFKIVKKEYESIVSGIKYYQEAKKFVISLISDEGFYFFLVNVIGSINTNQEALQISSKFSYIFLISIKSSSN
jgi:hypothetical protein